MKIEFPNFFWGVYLWVFIHHAVTTQQFSCLLKCLKNKDAHYVETKQTKTIRLIYLSIYTHKVHVHNYTLYVLKHRNRGPIINFENDCYGYICNKNYKCLKKNSTPNFEKFKRREKYSLQNTKNDENRIRNKGVMTFWNFTIFRTFLDQSYEYSNERVDDVMPSQFFICIVYEISTKFRFLATYCKIISP